MDIWHIKRCSGLRGEYTVQGSKNASLPILAASIVCPAVTELEGVPILRDVDACFAPAEPEAETNAPTVPVQVAGEAWRCPVCGYVYEGALPADFICPQCEQPASIFERVE